MYQLRSSRRTRRSDAGFSLLELMITVSIVGVIVVGLTGTVLAYLKNTVTTEARLTESHDVQFAAAYWQRDVSSVGRRSAEYDEATDTFKLLQSVDVVPACSLPSDPVVITLAWSEYSSLTSTDTPANVTVSYLYREDSDGGTLFRVRCTNATVDSTVEVAHSLESEPEPRCSGPGGTSCTGAGENVPTLIELDLVVRDPDRQTGDSYEATLVGERRQT